MYASKLIQIFLPDTCDPACKNGECIKLSGDDYYPDYYHCDCNDGWEGKTCGNMTDYCKSSPCKHDGHCEPIIGGFHLLPLLVFPFVYH